MACGGVGSGVGAAVAGGDAAGAGVGVEVDTGAGVAVGTGVEIAVGIGAGVGTTVAVGTAVGWSVGSRACGASLPQAASRPPLNQRQDAEYPQDSARIGMRHHGPPLSGSQVSASYPLQVSIEELYRPGPGRFRRLLLVTQAGVVHEGVVGAGVGVEFVRHP